jgi:hypothetical protein
MTDSRWDSLRLENTRHQSRSVTRSADTFLEALLHRYCEVNDIRLDELSVDRCTDRNAWRVHGWCVVPYRDSLIGKPFSAVIRYSLLVSGALEDIRAVVDTLQKGGLARFVLPRDAWAL